MLLPMHHHLNIRFLCLEIPQVIISYWQLVRRAELGTLTADCPAPYYLLISHYLLLSGPASIRMSTTGWMDEAVISE